MNLRLVITSSLPNLNISGMSQIDNLINQNNMHNYYKQMSPHKHGEYIQNNQQTTCSNITNGTEVLRRLRFETYLKYYIN